MPRLPEISGLSCAMALRKLGFVVTTVTATRIVMPSSVVRLSAGRTEMNDELQALCLHAGANSIFLGDKLLTTPNPGDSHDHELLSRLDTRLEPVDAHRV